MRSLLSSGFGFVLVATTSFGVVAQEPTVSGTVPAAVVPGQSTSVVLKGANLGNAKGIWTSFSAQGTLAELPENGTKADQVTYLVNVPSDAPVGVHGLRLWTDKGVSPLRLLMVDDLPSVAQSGNNTTPETAQVITAPVGVDGAIAALTVQYFKLTVAEKQSLSVEVVARRLGSTLDPMVRLLDLRGRELAFSDDAPGLSGDAQFSHTFAAAGEYLIEVRDIRYQGGAYRLRVGDFPCATVPYPMAVQRGQTASVTLAGSHVEGVEPVQVTAPADPQIRWLPVSLKKSGGQSSGFGTLAIVERAQFLETEPNNTAEQANRLDLLQDVNGRFEQPGDVDRYVFKATKDASFVFSGVTRELGSPSDLSLKILKADGSQLAIVDDTGIEEGSMTVKFPEEGGYTLVVEELTHKGGPSHAYRVAIRPSAAEFSLAASTDTVNIPAGGSALVTVTSKREGYAGPIELTVVGLPEGVTASRSVIGAGRNLAVLTLTAGPQYLTGTLQPLRIVGVGSSPEMNATAHVTPVLKTRFSNMRYPPQAIAEGIALSAATAPGFTWKSEPAEVTFGKQLSTTIKLTAARTAGLDEAIVVAVEPAKEGLPAGVTVGVKNIDKGASEVAIAISADDKAALGDFTIGLTGTLKQNNQTIVQPLAVRLSLAAPLTASATAAGEGKLAAGGELMVVVKVVRNPALAGPVELAFVNLPAGVTAAPTTLAADQSEVAVKLTAAADAAKGAVNNVQVKATAAVGAAKFEAVTSNLSLTVE